MYEWPPYIEYADGDLITELPLDKPATWPERLRQAWEEIEKWHHGGMSRILVAAVFPDQTMVLMYQIKYDYRHLDGAEDRIRVERRLDAFEPGATRSCSSIIIDHYDEVA